ncbi:carbamoyltransferase N-terminal domain-containing protein [Plantactinospora sp. KBS50]|uniref:carbamoyltransferase N-terminal domain-containing protein n=1 Tax=Plantactinospora sp. KBS50 TaxID=2024580 RepID=UPI000BAAB366|nr:carbamoyltransferase N-terminal domain-containing protein [Plantactinospora sp. KBS50]ASW56474.1 hypothetical protein CIK06_23405 [Plantactinospora sp. KBS50]
MLTYLPLDPAKVVEPAMPAHHLAHAYSAYATSPFASTDVLVVDEQGSRLPEGRYERSTWCTGDSGPLWVRQRFFGSGSSLSLGMFFDVVAALVGLSEAGLPAAGKLMALAAYGRDRPWPDLVQRHPDGDTEVSLAELDHFLGEVAKVPVNHGYDDWPPSSIEDLRLKYRAIRWWLFEVKRG